MQPKTPLFTSDSQHPPRFGHAVYLGVYCSLLYYTCYVEPQILHRVKNRYQGKCVCVWSNFDNFGGLKSVLKFHIFICLTCEESVRIRLICEELVRFFSDVKNWYSIFTNVKNSYQFLTHVKNWYSIFTNVKNRYQILTHVKNWYQMLTNVKIGTNYHKCEELVLNLHRCQ